VRRRSSIRWVPWPSTGAGWPRWEAAERNIDDRIDDLTRRYHQQRQAQITEELLEIVAGFETLSTVRRGPAGGATRSP
jgi:hypothetical protein